MGTLYKQLPRNYRRVDSSASNSFLEEINNLSKKYNVSKIEVIEAFKVLELKRKNDLFVDNGDTHDEQLCGIGKEIQNLSSSIASIADALEQISD